MRKLGWSILAVFTLAKLQANSQVIQKPIVHNSVGAMAKQPGVRYISQVHVAQIGQENRVSLVTKAKEQQQTVLQEGSRNVVDSKLTGSSIQQDIYQRGNDNVYRIEANSVKEGQQLRVLQDGHRQHLIIEGSNAMSQGMQVISKTVDQTIIIRNYK